MRQASAKVDGHGMSESTRGEGFHAVDDSGSLVCSDGELEEGISATGDSKQPGTECQSLRGGGWRDSGTYRGTD